MKFTDFAHVRTHPQTTVFKAKEGYFAEHEVELPNYSSPDELIAEIRDIESQFADVPTIVADIEHKYGDVILTMRGYRAATDAEIEGFKAAKKEQREAAKRQKEEEVAKAEALLRKAKPELFRE